MCDAVVLIHASVLLCGIHLFYMNLLQLAFSGPRRIVVELNTKCTYRNIHKMGCSRLK